jgi:hypothetical protein
MQETGAIIEKMNGLKCSIANKAYKSATQQTTPVALQLSTKENSFKNLESVF